MFVTSGRFMTLKVTSFPPHPLASLIIDYYQQRLRCELIDFC